MTATLSILDPVQEWQQWNQQEAANHVPKLVPPEIRAQYAQETALAEFYEDCRLGRWESIGRKGRSKGTRQKDRQSLNRLERFTCWRGPSLQLLESASDAWFDGILQRMREAPMSDATVDATRSHLLTIMRHAVRVRAITRHPVGERERATPKTRIYTPVEVSVILEAFEVEPLLQAAFWLALHIGPRTEDLFLFRWEQIIEDILGRKLMDYRAIKTGKLQAVPIAPCVWDMLDRLDSKSGTHLFPGLGNPHAADPEKSAQARMRNALAKRIMQRAGIDVPEKPWQVARATCNERYERHRKGVGQFILGHSCKDINATSYREPTEAVWEAVLTLPSYTKGTQQRLPFG